MQRSRKDSSHLFQSGILVALQLSTMLLPRLTRMPGTITTSLPVLMAHAGYCVLQRQGTITLPA
jgi:hypothetical protein